MPIVRFNAFRAADIANDDEASRTNRLGRLVNPSGWTTGLAALGIWSEDSTTAIVTAHPLDFVPDPYWRPIPPIRVVERDMPHGRRFIEVQYNLTHGQVTHLDRSIVDYDDIPPAYSQFARNPETSEEECIHRSTYEPPPSRGDQEIDTEALLSITHQLSIPPAPNSTY